MKDQSELLSEPKGRALLVVTHGSRRMASNHEVEKLVERVHPQLKSHYSEVKCAFLELAQPSIETAIAELDKEGVSEIVVLPYFLVSGSHCTEDIPAIISSAQRDYPKISFLFAPYIGKSPEMEGLIAKQAVELLE